MPRQTYEIAHGRLWLGQARLEPDRGGLKEYHEPPAILAKPRPRPAQLPTRTQRNETEKYRDKIRYITLASKAKRYSHKLLGELNNVIVLKLQLHLLAPYRVRQIDSNK